MRPQRRQLKNLVAEAEQFRRRALLGFAAVVLALGGLAGWYFKLQVVDGADYALRAEANRIKPRPIVPGRGLIYDRKGRILADNVPAFRLDVVPDKAGDPKRLVAELGRIVALTPDDIAAFEAVRKASRSFRAITLKLRISDEEAARFAVDRWRFPGVELVPYLNRRYPYGDLFSQIIGYVGRIDEKDLQTMGETHAAFTHIGKTGVERYYEEALRGKIGFERVETNVEGRAMRQLGVQPASPGADLRLSVDLDLQRAMVAAFGELEGAAVAIDPRSGEILAMVSLPGYDPNLFVNGISHADYKALIENPSRPLFNRNVLGGGPPGSTVKPLIALAGLDSGLRTPEFKVFSTGEFHIPGQRGRGWRDAHGGAGWTDLRKSIAASVNFYYYKLAYEMGIERFDRYMQKYGFGAPTGIDLVGERAGAVPSPQDKAKHSREPWYPGETVNAGIGQGSWVATTLQLVRGTAAIADGGLLRRPHLVAARRDGYQTPWTPLAQPEPVRISDNAGHVRAVQEGMMGTMLPGGTGRATAAGAPYPMAGKTGTAQRISRKGGASFDPRSLPYHLRHQALFVGYAPAENPTIALAVSVEHGGYGGTTAGPIARKIFDAWLLGKRPEQPGLEAGDSGLGTIIVGTAATGPGAAVSASGREAQSPLAPSPQIPVPAPAQGTSIASAAVATSGQVQQSLPAPSPQIPVPAPEPAP